jgi:hypothetical protein
VQALEQRQFEQLAEIAEKGIAGLADSTAAIKRFMRDQSETPRKPLPTVGDRG